MIRPTHKEQIQDECVENPLDRMSVEDVMNWFSSMQLLKVAEFVKKEKIDGEGICLFERSDFMEIGVPSGNWQQFQIKWEKLKKEGYNIVGPSIPNTIRSTPKQKPIVIDPDDQEIISVLLSKKKSIKEIAKKVNLSEILIQEFINSSNDTPNDTPNDTTLQSCRYGSSCSEKNRKDHCTKFKHDICSWGQQCININNKKHTSKFRHLEKEPCKYDPKCNQTHSMRHRLQYRHEGICDIPIKCRYGRKCNLSKNREHCSNYAA